MAPPEDFRNLACDIVDVSKDCFGIDVQYLPRSGGKFQIRGIFDNTYEAVDPDTEAVISSNQPILDIKAKDLPRAPEKGDCVIVDKLKYRVIDSQEDGLAAIKLILHKVD